MSFHMNWWQLVIDVLVGFVVGFVVSYFNTKRMLAKHAKRVKVEHEIAMRGAAEKLEAVKLWQGTEPVTHKAEA